MGGLPSLLVFVVGIWTGFIVLDGATCLLIVLVLSVGLDVVSANAAKSAIITTVAAVTLPLLAAGGSIEWRAAGADRRHHCRRTRPTRLGGNANEVRTHGIGVPVV